MFTRQRVAAALASSSPLWRSVSASTPLWRARSISRRVAVMSKRAGLPLIWKISAASPAQPAASSAAHMAPCRSPGSTIVIDEGASPY